ncbi:hypothetical protein GDO81_021794 [Engystomops pustulosus]|uniref:Uncharacterized protein n=1 Tax=Engystomops pustulosus TaxID=76066 RepID=A0AAV6YN91_ENGPU|nr:hypothetical protein GDO81_021794 [Engystomops pustulosus]
MHRRILKAKKSKQMQKKVRSHLQKMSRTTSPPQIDLRQEFATSLDPVLYICLTLPGHKQ